jgi:hypothetical protein
MNGGADSSTPAPGPACVPNIGAAQRRMRLVGGLVAAAAGLGALGLLLSMGAPRWWRLVLFFPFLAANVGILQDREKT